jgi:hypothetical protein
MRSRSNPKGWQALVPPSHRVLLAALLFCGGLSAQEGGGQAEIGFQQYSLTAGSRRVAGISGLTLSFSQFIPGVGLFSAGLAPALSNNRFRTGEDYLRLKGLPWKGQHWDFAAGDFHLPGQLLVAGFTNFYVPEISGRGFAVEATHGGRSIGFFYGTGTIGNTPRVVLRTSVPQSIGGFYLRQKVGQRLVVGARVTHFSTDLATLQSTSNMLIQGQHSKSATAASLNGMYTFAGPFKWYSEATWSASQPTSSNWSARSVPFSLLSGPLLETKFIRIRANYARQSASYFPLLGYYLGDRQGPFGEVTLHPLAGVDIFGSASRYQNNVAKNPSLPEYRNASESIGASLQLPGRFSLNGQITLLDLIARQSADGPWDQSKNRQRTATLARAFVHHDFRVSARDYSQTSRLSPQRQRSVQFEDTVHSKHVLVGGGFSVQRLIGTESRSTVSVRGLVQVHFGPFSGYANIEKGSDLQNRTLFATNTISTTVMGANLNLGRQWQIDAEAYRNNLITELNPQSIFVLQGQGVFVPGTLAGLNQWSLYIHIRRSFRWGKAGAATDLGKYAISNAPLKGSIEGFVRERLSAGNRPVDGIVVSLDGSRTTTSDEQGRFHFADVPEGLHRVSLSSEELLADFDPGPNHEQMIAISPGKLVRGDLDVVRLTAIEGKLTGPQGTALDTITIRMEPGGRYTTADADGTFHFYGLHEGDYSVSVDEKTLPEHALLDRREPIAVRVAPDLRSEPILFHFEIREPVKPVRKVFGIQGAATPAPISR